VPTGGAPPASAVAAPRIAATITARLVPTAAARAAPTLTDVAFASPSRGAAVGSRCGGAPETCAGVILATGDGGRTWTQAAAVPSALGAARFLPGGFGWAWGADALYTTADGGGSWTARTLPAVSGWTGPLLLFVSFASPSQGLAALGREGACATQGCTIALFQTSDGGARWSPVADNLPVGAGPAGLPAPALGWMAFSGGGLLGADRGWLLSQTPAGEILTTADGGRRWNPVLSLDAGGGPSAAAFSGPQGWAAGGGALFASGDGGSSWQRLGALSGPPLAIAAAPGGGSAWVLTTVGGQPPCPGGTPACGDAVAVASPHGLGPAVAAPVGETLEALAPLDAKTAWAVATGPWPGTALLHTSDAGRQWTVALHTGVTAPAGPWGFWDATQGWAVGSATDPEAVLRTGDGGRTWAVVGTVPAGSVYGAGFFGAARGWVVTGQGRLLVTADGGRSWTAHPLPGDVCQPPAVGFATAASGWISGGWGCGASLLRTTDGGGSWQQPPTLPGGVVLSAVYTPSGAGWAVVEPGSRTGDVLLEESPAPDRPWTATADLGPVDWPASAPPPLWVGATLSTDPAGGLWLGNLRSADGGRTWTRYILPAGAGAGGAAPLHVQFVSAQDGWLAAPGGLYATADGGVTWRQVSAYGEPPA
jgi:photosystem II stability/assembly factor-like uncharacterized protein